jgi:murein DD-endopeptidase MepM/ murein hydrolase activator NlpD
MWGGLRARRRVRVGSILGYVGNTGNAATTPPHLHYGNYTAKGAINPNPLLAGDPARTPGSDPIFWQFPKNGV